MDLELRKTVLKAAGWTAEYREKVTPHFDYKWGMWWHLTTPDGKHYNPNLPKGEDELVFENGDHQTEDEAWKRAPAVETDIQLAMQYLPISGLISVNIKYRTEVSAIEFMQEAVNVGNDALMSIPSRSICFETPETEDLPAEYCRLWLIYKAQEPEIERVREW